LGGATILGVVALAYFNWPRAENHRGDDPIGEFVSYDQFSNSKNFMKSNDGGMQSMVSGRPAGIYYTLNPVTQTYDLGLVLTNDKGKPIFLGRASDVRMKQKALDTLAKEINQEINDENTGDPKDDYIRIYGKLGSRSGPNGCVGFDIESIETQWRARNIKLK